MIASLETNTPSTPKTGRRGYPAAQVAAMVADYKALGSWQQVGRKWGRCPRSIRATLRAHGAIAAAEPIKPQPKRTGRPPSVPVVECENRLSEAERLELASTMRPYISKMAATYAQAFHQDMAELEHLGFLQAYKSSCRWRPDGGAKFFGYSHQEIRNAMGRHCMRFGNAVTVPLSRFGEVRTFSINAPLSNDEGSETYESVFLKSDEDVTSEADAGAIRGLLEDLFEQLPQRERAIMHGRFFEGRTLKDLATQHGLVQERARQIINGVLSKWRKHPSFKQFAEGWE